MVNELEGYKSPIDDNLFLNNSQINKTVNNMLIHSWKKNKKSAKEKTLKIDIDYDDKKVLTD